MFQLGAGGIKWRLRIRPFDFQFKIKTFDFEFKIKSNKNSGLVNKSKEIGFIYRLFIVQLQAFQFLDH